MSLNPKRTDAYSSGKSLERSLMRKNRYSLENMLRIQVGMDIEVVSNGFIFQGLQERDRFIAKSSEDLDVTLGVWFELRRAEVLAWARECVAKNSAEDAEIRKLISPLREVANG